MKEDLLNPSGFRKFASNQQFEDLRSFNKRLLEERTTEKKGAIETIHNRRSNTHDMFDAIDEAIEKHRMNMLNLEGLGRYYGFERIQNFGVIEEMDQLRTLEMFIKCKMESHMKWIYELEERTLDRLSPRDRIYIRRSNRASNFHRRIQEEMSLKFPVTFLNLNLNSNFFIHREGAGYRIIKIGLKMIITNLRCGFYTFSHLSNLLTFVRQKYRFLKTWAGGSEWEEEGQWFMIKFVKQCLFIIVDYAYELLSNDDKERISTTTKNYKTLPTRKRPIDLEASADNLLSSREALLTSFGPGETPIVEKGEIRSTNCALSLAENSLDSKNFSCDYSGYIDGFSYINLLTTVKKRAVEESREIEENIHLLEEIFSNSVLGWTASGKLAFKYPGVDEQILFLSEYFFCIKPVVLQFEPLEQLSLKTQGECEERLKTSMVELERLTEEVRNADSLDIRDSFINKVKRILRFLGSAKYPVYFQTSLASVIKNIIDLLISVYEYFYQTKSREPNNQILKRRSEKLPSDLKPNVINFSPILSHYLSIGEQDEWEEVLRLALTICMKNELVYILVSDEYCLWQLFKIFPKTSMKLLLDLDKSSIVKDAGPFLDYLFESFIDIPLESSSPDDYRNVCWGMIFALDTLKHVVLKRRKSNAYEYQFECKTFNLIYRFYCKAGLEKYFEGQLVENNDFDFSILEEQNIEGNPSYLDYSRFIEEKDSKMIETSDTNKIKNILLYKILEILEITSQRFYCVSFEKGNKDFSIALFRKKVIEWTYEIRRTPNREDINASLREGTRTSLSNEIPKVGVRKKSRLELIYTNKNLVPILVKILRLQINLFMNAPNAVLDDSSFNVQMSEKEGDDNIYLINRTSPHDLAKSNFKFVTDSKFSNHMNQQSSEKKIYVKVIKVVMEQLIHLLSFLDVMYEEFEFEQLISYENLLDMLRNLQNLIDKQSCFPVEALNRKITPEVNFNKSPTMETIHQELMRKKSVLMEYVKKHNLCIDLDEKRRTSIYRCSKNKVIFNELSRFSLRQGNVNEETLTFSKSLMSGHNFEVEINDILKGLANVYIRVFGRMWNGLPDSKCYSDQHDMIFSKCDEKGHDFIWHNRSGRYFFFNEIYFKYIVLFERITFEFDEFRIHLSNIVETLAKDSEYNDSTVYYQEVQEKEEYRLSVSGFLYNQFDVIVRLASCGERAIYMNFDWSIIYSQHCLCVFTIQSLIHQDFDFFKDLFGKGNYNPVDRVRRGAFYSFVEAMTNIAISMMKKMKFDHLSIKREIADAIWLPYKTNYPLLKIIVDLLTSSVGDNNENEVIISECLINLLMNFLLVRLHQIDSEIINLKYSAAKLIIQILKKKNSELTFLQLNQNGLELKTIYEYTIFLTKHQLIDLILKNKLDYKNKLVFLKQQAGPHINQNSGIGQISSEELTKRGVKRSKTKNMTGIKQETLEVLNQLTSRNNRDKKKTILNQPSEKKETPFRFAKRRAHLGLDGIRRIDYEASHVTSASLMIYAYSLTNCKNIGFHLISNLLTMMTYFEENQGGKYWSLRKQESDVFYLLPGGKLKRQKINKKVKEEMAIVNFLIKTNREIEIVDKQGKNKIILFQNFPELIMIRELIVEEFFGDFDSENVLHKVIQYVPQLLIQVKYYHRFNIQWPKLSKLVDDESLWSYRTIIWSISFILNIICLLSYSHINRLMPIDTRYYTQKVLINSIAALIGILALGQFFLWMYTKYHLITKVNIEKFKIEHKSINSSSIFNYIRVRIFNSILFQETIISVILHCLFGFMGVFYSRLFHSFHLLMFIFISKPIRNVVFAIVKNIKEMVMIFVFAVFIIYIYSMITLIHYSNDFRTDTTRGFDICQNLSSCFLNVLNLGLRNGGGIAESMTQMYTTYYQFLPKVFFDLSFFILINVIALNMVFGIIIDTFSEMREKESSKKFFLSNYCLICRSKRIEFETRGIRFEKHFLSQHNIYDYMAFLLRLHLKHRSDYTEEELYMWECYQKKQIKWAPVKKTLYLTKDLMVSDQSQQESNHKDIILKPSDIQTKSSSMFSPKKSRMNTRLESNVNETIKSIMSHLERPAEDLDARSSIEKMRRLEENNSYLISVMSSIKSKIDLQQRPRKNTTSRLFDQNCATQSPEMKKQRRVQLEKGFKIEVVNCDKGDSHYSSLSSNFRCSESSSSSEVMHSSILKLTDEMKKINLLSSKNKIGTISELKNT